MDQDKLFLTSVMSWIMIASAVVLFIFLQFVNAPYGRFTNSSFGPGINPKLAWFIQEIPSVIIPFSLIYFHYEKMSSIANYVLIISFIFHYIQRSFIYPLLMKAGRPMPILTCLSAFLFCAGNGFMQIRHIIFTNYDSNEHLKLRFNIGIILYVVGLIINIHSDSILRNLRKPNETGYKIPTGGIYNYVSCGNYFGEILEWFGYALACNSIAGLAFFILTVANIGPRAIEYHRWYKKKFVDYPKSRKALIPFLL